MTTTVTCFGPAGARVAIHSDQAVVTSSLGHLFAPWWNPKNLREGAEPAAHVTVRVDRQIQEAGRSLLRDPNLREGRYAGQRLLFTTGQGAVRAYCPHDAVAYEAVGNHVTVTGLTRTSVILAASRVVVDLVWGLMEAQGYTLVRASSATSGARAVLTLDGPGSGMSTSALLLAAEHHYGLQATEAVFARVESDGSISTRAWANPISIGLQQLYALGWSETVCALAEREGVLHPSTDPRVIDALKAGRGTALLDADGAELTVRLWPRAADQFGVFTTHTAGAAAVVVPTAGPVAASAGAGQRTVNGSDVLLDATDEGDPLGLRPRSPDRRTTADRLVRALAALPHHYVDLTDGIPLSTRAVDTLADAY
nr:hypothetical protein OH826_19335 [Streptomyces sp. NBC_00899]